MDDSENNAKVSDSAYSTSCSNSQSRRSGSSKSTHSGSHSSGSSGYGGKPSTSGSSNVPDQTSEKRNKESNQKKKKQTVVTKPPVVKVKAQAEVAILQPAQLYIEERKEEIQEVAQPSSGYATQTEKGVENMDISTPESTKDEVITSSNHRQNSNPEDFSCVISMHDGIVMYTTPTLTSSLGFPKEMWIGRSFICFLHPKDRSTFASQITSELVAPKTVNGTQEKGLPLGNTTSTMFCRIRKYRGLTSGYGAKERVVIYSPFFLKLSFKNISDEEGKVIYLVIQATPVSSAYKIPNEIMVKSTPFIMRHVANGNVEYVDNKSVPYLGYFPQDIVEKDAIQLYHPEDLAYLMETYQEIVKEGKVSRSKPYRLLAQNGCYVKVETEWSSFVNPWSRKLEFIIEKNYVIEGPSNPDVFQAPGADQSLKLTEELKAQASMFRENILRIMNEVLTKPAEFVKQQMTKRCQDLATFMETLMVEQTPRNDEELRLEIQDPDNSYYERDSGMLGGISPHHDYSENKSSAKAQLSYNQLNYNENLQRYFDSHRPCTFMQEYNTPINDDKAAFKIPKPASKCLSPIAQNSGDSSGMSSFGECSSLMACDTISSGVTKCNLQPLRLTESLLKEHNAEMEKELVKKCRETLTCTKEENEKTSNETRQKKKEHLARCVASFQPAADEATPVSQEVSGTQSQGVKRPASQEGEASAHKLHRSSGRSSRRKQNNTFTAPCPPTFTTAPATNHWAVPPVNSMNTCAPGIGMQQQMSLMSPMTAVTNMIPMYYVPTANVMPPNPEMPNYDPSGSRQQYPAPPMQYMMYGQAVFGSPIVYSPIGTGMSFPMQQTMMAQNMQQYDNNRSLGLSINNYEEACKTTVPPKSSASHTIGHWREKKRAKSSLKSSKAEQGSGANSSSGSSTNALNRSMKAATETTPSSKSKTPGTGEEARTDGESSYSSFYSSFFKTESGSAEDSGPVKNKSTQNKNTEDDKVKPYNQEGKDWPKRKMEPPWMEKVCVSSELIYKYQILTKTMNEVLLSDQQKMAKLEQPTMVNDQLDQLYLDLQLQGVAAKLTLEEGVTSSASSGEETYSSGSKKRKVEYSKLTMIYEEDAPLPPPMPKTDEKE